MKIEFSFDKTNLIRLGAAAVLGAALLFRIGFPAWVLAGFLALYFVIKSLRIELKKSLSWLWAGILLGSGSVFTAYHIQYLLLDAELRGKISNNKMMLNILCCMTVFLVAQAIAGRTHIACIVSHVSLMLLAGVNYFVYLFRGNEFIFSDIRSAQTGLSVAGNYEFVLDVRAGFVILISTLYVALMRKLSVSFERRAVMTVLVVSLAVLLGVYVGNRTKGVVTETWEQKGSYRNGYLLNFVLSIRDSFVAEPEGYSAEAVAALEEQYGGDAPASAVPEGGGDGRKPTIIVVMNESYADLGVVGDFSTNLELTPFYNSLRENTLKGYALSSVFGAKTPNSEWEFLTGNSMAFLPGGSVVYQQYITHTPDSLVSDLKRIGYTCVAMHPYYETGWSRNVVYPDLGFDEMYFINDFDQTKLLREYITDRELYEKIVERYERRGRNENLFLMTISMQNHGGYTEKYANFTEQARMLGIYYPDVNQYLSLLKESDDALAYLISYFSAVDEPVEIVFFGDHQPSLSSSFYPHLNGKGLSGLTLSQLEDLYTVPFFIWTNYESGEETEEITSLNYLSTLALERAGIELPPYRRFLADLREKIPAVNARAYYSESAGRYRHLEDAQGEEAEWLKKYEILQYNNMFGKKEKSSVFFPYYE